MKFSVNRLSLVLFVLLASCGGGETVPPDNNADPALAIPPNRLAGCPVAHPPLLSSPKEVVIEPGGSTALITEHGAGAAGRLTRVNLQTGAMQTIVCGFIAPEGLAITPDGTTAWVLESFTGFNEIQNNRLFKVDLAAGIADMFADKFFHTEGIALEAGGLSALVVSYAHGGMIARVDLTAPQVDPPRTNPGTTTTTTTNGDIGVTRQGVTPLVKGLSYPEGIVVSALSPHRIWVAQGFTNLVSWIDLGTGRIILSLPWIGENPPSLPLPQRIVLEAGEASALVTSEPGTLFRLNLNNGAVTALVTGLGRPQGLALEANSDIVWVVEECAGLTRIDLSVSPPARTTLVAASVCVID